MRGFTLIELAIVIVIAGILAAVAIPIYRALSEDAKWTEAEGILDSLKSAAEVYKQRYGDADFDTLDIPMSSSVASWSTLGIDATTWNSQYFAVDNFSLSTSSNGVFTLVCDSTQGGGNPPKAAGTITVTGANIWTRTGSAQ